MDPVLHACACPRCPSGRQLYLAATAEASRAGGLPVLSVDTRAEELAGNFAGGGAAWLEEPVAANAQDFVGDALGRAVPYGRYDLPADTGPVVVGTAAGTPDFAAAAVARRWPRCGGKRCRGAGGWLLRAGSGGGNGCRPRLGQRRLQGLADWYGLEATGWHYPRGASKGGPVEHRLFSQASRNWAGVPLRAPALLPARLRGTRHNDHRQLDPHWQHRHLR